MLPEQRFLISLAATVVVEAPIVLIFSKFVFKCKEKFWKILLIAALASVLTLPYLWFIFPPFFNARYYLYYGEGVVFVVEALLYFALLNIRIWKAFLISFLANVASYAVGIFFVKGL